MYPASTRMDKASEWLGTGSGDGVEVPGESSVGHVTASEVEIKSLTTSQKLKMGLTVTKENLIGQLTIMENFNQKWPSEINHRNIYTQ